MRALLFVSLLACGHVAESRDSKTAQAFAGCYELKVEGWHLFRSWADEFLPKRFQLTTRPVREGFVVKNLDAKVRSDLPLSSWNVKDKEKIGIVWSTGFVGWNIQLGGPGTGLRGTAEFFTDTDPKPSRSDTVVAHALDCKGPN